MKSKKPISYKEFLLLKKEVESTNNKIDQVLKKLDDKPELQISNSNRNEVNIKLKRIK